MTYTVAAICGTDENFEYNNFYGGDSNALIQLTGTGSIKVGLNDGSNLNQTFEHSFNPVGYLHWPTSFNINTTTGRSVVIATAGRYASVLGNYIAVTKNKCVVLSNGVVASPLGINYYAGVRVIQNNVSTTQELYTGTAIEQEYTNMWIPLGITAGIDTFYMVAAAIQGTRYDPDIVLKIRSSADGINWSDTGESVDIRYENISPALDSFLNSIQNREFQEMKLHRTLSGERYFLYSEYSGRVIYSNAAFSGWTDHPIGRFDGMHWYKDNGNMFLCAVRIGDDGCYGTKICDAYGNMQPISWRRSATPWDRTKNRLDARYVVGMRPIVKLVPKQV